MSNVKTCIPWWWRILTHIESFHVKWCLKRLAVKDCSSQFIQQGHKDKCLSLQHIGITGAEGNWQHSCTCVWLMCFSKTLGWNCYRSDWWAMSKLVLHCVEEFWLTLNPPQVLSSSFVLLCRGTGRPPSSYHGNFTLHKRNQNLCWIYSPHEDDSWWGIKWRFQTGLIGKVVNCNTAKRPWRQR